jgi:hypothetical protein
MELIDLGQQLGFRKWGCFMAEKPYVIVEDLKTGEFTASTKNKDDRTIYILDYGAGAPTLEEAKEAVLKYHKKVLS